MKTLVLAATIFVICLANATGQAELLTSDPLTRFPLLPATESGKRIGNLSYTYDEPTKMPDAQPCKGRTQGDFYSLNKTQVDATVKWYSSHLSGFKQVRGYESGVRKSPSTNPTERLWLL